MTVVQYSAQIIAVLYVYMKEYSYKTLSCMKDLSPK